jgi:hypothetical protein
LNIKALASPGLKAVKDNWRAIVLIQGCFLAFVILYYTLPSFKALPASVESFRNKIGPQIFVVTTIWFVSIAIPEIAKRVTRQKADPITGKDLALRLVYFAIIGLSVDYLYTWMGATYGNGPQVAVIAKKVLTDMFLYSPLVSMPLAAVTFLYRDMDFSWPRTSEALRKGEFWKRVFPLLVTCWMYFGPVTLAMYSLPVELNFPVAMAANAAWGIIVLAVGNNATPEGELV